jgi:hypothetical protein
MKPLLAFLLCLATALFLAGCKSSPVEPSPTKTDLLTGTVWQLQKALALGPATGQTTDITSQFPYLSMSFTKDGRYLTPIHNGTWQFVESETSILFDKDSISQLTAKIIELSATSFHFTVPTPTVFVSMPLDVSFVALQAGASSPETNFETLWKEFDTRYSFFEIKKINWDSLHTVYRAQVTSTTTDAQLFQIMSSLLSNLKDGHVSLTTSVGTYAYTGWYSQYPTNFLSTTAVARYFSADYGTTAGGYLRYAKIADSIGYLYIGPTLSGDQTLWTQAIDAIINTLKDCKGIIVDIRNNGGGNDALGNIVAGRFADQQRVYSYVRWRNGPSHFDFTEYQAATIQPQGPRQFTKPVAFLTNRHCFSSAEGTTLMMKALPNVTLIGDTTGGGSANPIALTLPNGWSYRVSRWIQYTAQKTVFEGTGLPPDIPLWISPADSVAGRDAILERAIQFLH